MRKVSRKEHREFLLHRSFIDFYEAYSGSRILPVARLYGRSYRFKQADIDDCMQEAFERVWKNWQEISKRDTELRIASTLTYLKFVVREHGQQKDLLSTVDPNTLPDEVSRSAEHAAIAISETDRLLQLLSELDPDDQDLLIQARFLNLSHAVLAAEFGCKPAAFRKRLSRLTQQLRNSMDDWQDGREYGRSI